jgi:hypothetical protein
MGGHRKLVCALALSRNKMNPHQDKGARKPNSRAGRIKMDFDQGELVCELSLQAGQLKAKTISPQKKR